MGNSYPHRGFNFFLSSYLISYLSSYLTHQQYIPTFQERYIATRSVDGTLYHNPHTDRDTINRSFFPLPDQIYPPLDIFESSTDFERAVKNPEVDLLSMFEGLTRCYEPDHPTFQKRFEVLAMKRPDQEILIPDWLITSHVI